MKKDDVMMLANQTAGHHWMDEAHIQRFAALVAAAERKQCVRVLLDGNYWNGAPREFYECAQNRAAAISARSDE